MDDPLPKLCPAVALSHQDGHHNAVALLLKAALIQVSDYRLLGASCAPKESKHTLAFGERVDTIIKI